MGESLKDGFFSLDFEVLLDDFVSLSSSSLSVCTESVAGLLSLGFSLDAFDLKDSGF